MDPSIGYVTSREHDKGKKVSQRDLATGGLSDKSREILGPGTMETENN